MNLIKTTGKPVRKILVFVAFLIFILALYAAYKIGQNHTTNSEQHEAKDKIPAVKTAEKKVLYWHDPMVPGQRFDKPGPSPFMDMDLVPVYANENASEDSGSGNAVSINAGVQQNLGIRIAEVELGQFATQLNAVGSVAYNQTLQDSVQARNAGYIDKLLVRAPLVRVQKGQVLAQLFVPEWVAAQEELLTVMRMQKIGAQHLPQGLLEAAKQRMRLVGMNDAQIQKVVNSGEVQARVNITSPRTGIITELQATEGMAVMLGAPLFRIQGLNSVWINADVPENNLIAIRAASSVEARTPALPNVIFKGRVSQLLPELDPNTRTLKVRIEINNVGEQLLPEMFTKLQFQIAPRQKQLFIPSEAIIQTGTRSVVMLALGEGQFAPQEIKIGAENQGKTQVLDGLQAGQKIVVSGQFLIDSEASLKAVETKTSPIKQSNMEMKP